MISKLINDIKYFFERLFSRDGKSLLMLSIIAGVIAVLEVIIFLFIIRNATRLSIPFLLIYAYLFYFINRFLIRGIQYILVRINVLKYGTDNFDYLENNIDVKVRKYNAMVYAKERDRYDATVVYIIILIIFFLVILHFVLNATATIKITITLLLLVPFIICIREPYEIITINNLTEDDLYDMTKKDFFENFLDKIFLERQVISPIELPGEEYSLQRPKKPKKNKSEQVVAEQNVEIQNNINNNANAVSMQEQGQMYPEQGQPMPVQPVEQPVPQPNPYGNINNQIDNNQITGQWWQQ